MQDDLAPARKSEAYHSDPKIMDGAPVFRGTQVPVSSLFDHLGAGGAIGAFIDQNPSVSKEAVASLLDTAKRLLEEEAFFAAELAR